MTRSNQITINGSSFLARHGELLLDAALSNGIDLPFDCRAGHCGTCCVRLVSGEDHLSGTGTGVNGDLFTPRTCPTRPRSS